MKPGSSAERGAALLTVLLLVALMGAICVAALDRLRMSTALAINSAALDQARAYAIGVESLITLAVDDLLAVDAERTILRPGEAGLVRQIPLPQGGNARIVLSDGANCFNVNSVADGAHPARLVTRPAGVAQFTALLQLLDVPGQTAAAIANSAADWVDGDGEPNPGGGEDALYAGRQVAYRVGNTLFADPSELRALASMTPAIFEQMQPWLCALPTTELSPINVNTLTLEQAPLLAMLAPGRISVDEARQAIAARPAGGWGSTSEFLVGTGLAAGDMSLDVQMQPQLRTRWFEADLTVRQGDMEFAQKMLIDARIRPVRVVARTWGLQ